MWKWLKRLFRKTETHNSPATVLPGGFSMEFKSELHNNPPSPPCPPGTITIRIGGPLIPPHPDLENMPRETGTGGRNRDIFVKK